MKGDQRPYIEQFKAICRTEFAFVISDYGFAEVEPLPAEYQNPFEFHLSKNRGRFIVEGIDYGSGAALNVQGPQGQRVSFHYLVTEGFWDTHRQGLGRGQPGSIRYQALCLREFGGAFLQGDWSALALLTERQEKWRVENWAAREAEERQRKARWAVDEAAPLFRACRYAEVAKILAPHEQSLTRAQLLRLRIARDRSGR